MKAPGVIAVCGMLLCGAAAGQAPEQAKVCIGSIAVEGLEERIAGATRARIADELSALGVTVVPWPKGAVGTLDVRVLRSGDMVRISMRFLDTRGTKVLEITTTKPAEGFPASLSLEGDLARGLESLGTPMPERKKPAVEEAPGIEAAYEESKPGIAEVREESSGDVSTWGWVVAGVGGALLAGGAVTGSMALSLNDELNQKCHGGICPPEYQDDIDRHSSLGFATDILLGVGAAVTLAGVLMVIFSDDDDTALVPAAGAGFAGALVRGRF